MSCLRRLLRRLGLAEPEPPPELQYGNVLGWRVGQSVTLDLPDFDGLLFRALQVTCFEERLPGPRYFTSNEYLLGATAPGHASAGEDGRVRLWIYAFPPEAPDEDPTPTVIWMADAWEGTYDEARKANLYRRGWHRKKKSKVIPALQDPDGLLNFGEDRFVRRFRELLGVEPRRWSAVTMRDLDGSGTLDPGEIRHGVVLEVWDYEREIVRPGGAPDREYLFVFRHADDTFVVRRGRRVPPDFVHAL